MVIKEINFKDDSSSDSSPSNKFVSDALDDGDASKTIEFEYKQKENQSWSTKVTMAFQ